MNLTPDEGGDVHPDTAFVIHIEPKSLRKSEDGDRDGQQRLAEAVSLTAAVGVTVTHALVVSLDRPVPATLIGSGKVEEIACAVRGLGPELVVVNTQLSPVQQRNLERAWKTKVVDRTALILEIFGERARTREGRLQVELAHLTWQRSRLVRSWTHLERQRGGFGFLGGPGETQIETDRRLIGERLAKIRKELESVKRTRGLQRKARKRVPFPVIALVGYTNAGKSTLFNTMTKADVFAKDLLFATLDPTMRGIVLPGGTKAVLSDTVGFIADLPHELVAAFRATLEEVLEADVVVHVRDGAHAETEAQKADVLKVLDELGVEPGLAFVEVLNKIDLMETEQRDAALARTNGTETGPVAISAKTGQGLDRLLCQLETTLTAANRTYRLLLEPADGQGLAWVYRHAQVLVREDTETGDVVLTIRCPPHESERFESRFIGNIQQIQYDTSLSS